MTYQAVVSVRDGSDKLAQGNEDLNDRTRQTVANVQQTVATMNQMAASVQVILKPPPRSISSP